MNTCFTRNASKMRPYINIKDKGKEGKRPENRHHIFPRERGGTNVKDNLIDIFLPVHRAVHTIGGTELIKGFIYQIMKINDTALTKEFKNDVDKLLKEDDLEYYYKNGIYHKR